MKYILIISIILTLASCNKECQITNGTYEFQISSTLYPALDTFNIGDTITIITEFNDQVYEAQTDKKYDLSNVTLYYFIRMYKISEFPTVRSAIDSFQFDYTGLNTYHYDYFTSSNYKVLRGDYSFNNHTYSIKYIFSPMDTGLFICSNGAELRGQTFPGKCDDMDSYFFVDLNNGNDNNISMLSQSPDEHFNKWVLEKPYDRFHSGAGYAFYVK